MYGVEEYYIELLNEAKSPEEIKQILVNKFVVGRGVPEEILDKVLKIDPTKKKTYTSWVLNLWNSERPLILESLENGTLRLLFHYYKTRNNEGLNLAGVASLSDAISMLPNIDTVLEKIGDGPENNFEIVYDTPEWKIAVPHSYEASEKLGKGCRWCTAGAFERGSYWYDQYTRVGRNRDGRGTGPLWINFDYSSRQTGIDHKDYPYTRYQFLFEWDNYRGEFMDYLDRRIDPSNIASMPEAVKEFYIHQDERYEPAIMGNSVQTNRTNANARENYLQQRLENAITVKEFSDGVKLLLIEPINTNGNTLYNNGHYLLYSSQDTSDPITYHAYRNDSIITSDENLPYASLRCGNNIICYFRNGNSFLPRNKDLCEFKIHDGYSVVCINDSNGKLEDILYADNSDSKYVRLGIDMLVLGNRRKITDVFKNKFISNGIFMEIVFENEFHLLYRENAGGAYSHVLTNIPENGEYYVAENGKIKGKYGIFDFNSGDNYKLYGLINSQYAIVAKNVQTGAFHSNGRVFNIYDSIRKELIGNDWYTYIDNLKKYNLVMANRSTGFEDIVIISLSTRQVEEIHDLHQIHQNYESYYGGTILSGQVKVKLPYSLGDIDFEADTPEKKNLLKNFIGFGNVSESLNNLYNRMIKKI